MLCPTLKEPAASNLYSSKVMIGMDVRPPKAFGCWHGFESLILVALSGSELRKGCSQYEKSLGV